MIENKKRLKVVSAVLFFFLGIIVCAGIFYFEDSIFSFLNIKKNNNICESKVTITDKGISDSVDKIYDAVVLIGTYKNDKLYGTGTGFFYKIDDKYGYLLTNYHVIEGNSSIEVTLTDDKVVKATYLGGDNYLDVAVLRVDKKYVLQVAEIGASFNSKLGDTVFTIGTPIDYQFRNTVTRGILSGKDRLVSIATNEGDYIMKAIQTDASINPGNSGGPLVNINGEVIGINSVKLVEDEVEGMGFAIAIEDIMNYVNVFEKGQIIKRPILGITMTEINNKNLSKLNITLDKNITYGVVVTDIVVNSSVYNVLQKGDVITRLNNVDIKSTAYLKYELYKHNVGDEITLTFIRNNEVINKNIILK